MGKKNLIKTGFGTESRSEPEMESSSGAEKESRFGPETKSSFGNEAELHSGSEKSRMPVLKRRISRDLKMNLIPKVKRDLTLVGERDMAPVLKTNLNRQGSLPRRDWKKEGIIILNHGACLS